MNRSFWWIMTQSVAFALFPALLLDFGWMESFGAFAISAVMNAGLVWRARHPHALDPADVDDDHLP